jgi:hypothetical protein
MSEGHYHSMRSRDDAIGSLRTDRSKYPSPFLVICISGTLGRSKSTTGGMKKFRYLEFANIKNNENQ